MRLDKFISSNSQYSRSEVKKIIKKGIYINDILIKDNKYIVDLKRDTVVLEGQVIKHIEHIYIMLNKPQGYLSATRDEKDRTVLDLINEKDKYKDIFPVGRLDKDTEGLIFLTNDGELAHKLTSPKKDVFKKYYVEVDGILLDEHVNQFKEGIIIDKDYKCKEAKLEILSSSSDKSSAHVYISEGRFHQIKKMIKAISLNVTYLKRLTIGDLVLDENLKLGEYRYLSDEEINKLR